MFKQIAISMLTMASLTSARRLEQSEDNQSGDDDEIGTTLTLGSDGDQKLPIKEGHHVEFQIKAPSYDGLCGWFLHDSEDIVRGDERIKFGGFEFINKEDNSSFGINAFLGGARADGAVQQLHFIYACDVFDIEEIETLQKVDVYVDILELSSCEEAERLRIEYEREQEEAEQAERLASKAAAQAQEKRLEAEKAQQESISAYQIAQSARSRQSEAYKFKLEMAQWAEEAQVMAAIAIERAAEAQDLQIRTQEEYLVADRYDAAASYKAESAREEAEEAERMKNEAESTAERERQEAEKALRLYNEAAAKAENERRN